MSTCLSHFAALPSLFALRYGDPEAAIHEVFLIKHTQLYVGGDVYFRQLDALCQPRPEGPAIVVTGESGSGKTRFVCLYASTCLALSRLV